MPKEENTAYKKKKLKADDLSGAAKDLCGKLSQAIDLRQDVGMSTKNGQFGKYVAMSLDQLPEDIQKKKTTGNLLNTRG